MTVDNRSIQVQVCRGLRTPLLDDGLLQFPACGHSAQVSKKLRTNGGILVASVSVVAGMWLERLIIVVPSLANPRLDYPTGIYLPILMEWSLFAGGVATFMLGFLLFTKFFPLVSIWEIQEGRESGIVEVTQRIQSYLPDERFELGEVEPALSKRFQEYGGILQ